MALRKCVFVERCHERVVPIPFDEMEAYNPCLSTFTYNVSLDEEMTIPVRTGGTLGKHGDLIIPPIKFTSMDQNFDISFDNPNNPFETFACFKKTLKNRIWYCFASDAYEEKTNTYYYMEDIVTHERVKSEDLQFAYKFQSLADIPTKGCILCSNRYGGVSNQYWYYAEGYWVKTSSVYFIVERIINVTDSTDTRDYDFLDYAVYCEDIPPIPDDKDSKSLYSQYGYASYSGGIYQHKTTTRCMLHFVNDVANECEQVSKEVNSLSKVTRPWKLPIPNYAMNSTACHYWTCALKNPESHVEPTEPEEPPIVTDSYFEESEYFMTKENGYSLSGDSFEKYISFHSTQGYNKDSNVYHRISYETSNKQYINETSLVKSVACNEFATVGGDVINLTNKFTTSEGTFYSTDAEISDVYQDTDLEEEELPW